MYLIDNLTQEVNKLKTYSNGVKDIYNHLSPNLNYEEVKNIVHQTDSYYRKVLTIYQMVNLNECKGNIIEKEILKEIHSLTGTVVKTTSDIYKAVCVEKYHKLLEDDFGFAFVDRARGAKPNFQSNDNEYQELIKQEKELLIRYKNAVQSANIVKKKNDNIFGIVSLEEVNKCDYKKAHIELNQRYMNVYPEAASIYLELINVRNLISRKMGFLNYFEFRNETFKIPANDTRQFIEKNIDYIKKLDELVRNKQLNVLDQREKIPYYYANIFFKSQNKQKWEIDQTINIAKSIHPELESLLNELNDKGFIDTLPDLNRAERQFTTYLYDYKLPYIFTNYTNSLRSVQILTHEIGHAFEKHINREQALALNFSPPLDVAESHAITFEFLFALKEFEQSQNPHYFTYVLFKNISVLILGLKIYEFEYACYTSEKELCSDDLAVFWKQVNDKYASVEIDVPKEMTLSLLNRDWIHHHHVFTSPCYYVAYVIAKMMAFQFIESYQKNPEEAFQNYLTLCKYGAWHQKDETLKLANLVNPYKEELGDNISYLCNLVKTL